MRKSRTDEVLASARVIGFRVVVYRDGIPVAAFGLPEAAELWARGESAHAALSIFQVLRRPPFGITHVTAFKAGKELERGLDRSMLTTTQRLKASVQQHNKVADISKQRAKRKRKR
jgi:hypothetical protein